MNIKAWLEGMDLEQYARSFTENGVDLSLLPELTNEDLKDLGVDRLIDRKTVLKAILQLSENEDVSTTESVIHDTISGERRQVTVLFADIAGYTKLSRKLGAEETHALLNRYFDTVDSIVESYGGTVDKHMGDNVMAVFGAPIAHDNDPFRAIRVAIDIHDRLESLSEELGYNLLAHIGIASGQVVASGTGSDTHREYTVTGDSVNLASRLQDHASPGETLIADSVWRVVESDVNCASLGEVSVKGLDLPVQVWKVNALHSDLAFSASTPFVGRNSELKQFSALIEACIESGCGQTILIRGEAGMGKTRLVEEFTSIARSQGFDRHKALVLDFGVGKGQDAIRMIVRSLLNIQPGGNKSIRQSAADKALSNDLVTSTQRIFLHDLLDLPQLIMDRATYEAMDNATRNDGKRDVISRLIKKTSARAPIIILIEDIHWADRILLEHLAEMTATAADSPVVMLMTSRIEGDPLDQAWRGSIRGSPLTTMDLGPLRKEDAIKMAGVFVDATNQFAESCIERAEGNPLFLEQLLRNAEENHEEEMPASIQRLVLARMDRLSAEDKRALQAASVIGQRFSLDTLCHLLGEERYSCDGLLEHHLIRPEGGDYLFAHALIQEGVYSSLLKPNRCEFHARVANWFSDRDPILHAQHLDRAEDQNAPQAYLEAAEGQATLYRYERAQQLVERGLEIAQDKTTKFSLMKFSGDLFLNMGQGPAAVNVFREALDSAVNEIQTCHALIGLASGMRYTDELEEALPYLDRAEGYAISNKLNQELASLHHLRGNLYFHLSKIDRCYEEHKLALNYAQSTKSPESEAQALGGLGDAEYAMGKLLTAHKTLMRCFELCREHGFIRIEAANLLMVGGGGTFHYMLDLDAAISASLSSIELAERVGHDRAELMANFSASQVYFDTGEFSKAGMHLDRSKVLIERIATRRFLARNLHHMGRIRLAQGDRREATKLCRKAMSISRQTGAGYCGPLILATLARATNDADERAKALSEGQQLLDEGCVSHNYYEFYIDGMEGALERQEWKLVHRYADALEVFTRIEPLPRTDFFITRGRALSNFGSGSRDEESTQRLRNLRDEAELIGLKTALSAFDIALDAR